MDTQSIWELLSGISVGQIVAWIIVLATIIAFLCTGTIKLYKIFTKYKETKDRDETQRALIEGHDETLREIQNALESIKKSLEEQKEVNLKQVRYTIVHTCEEALERGEISINKLRSLEEMYEEYIDIFHGNGYVKTLITRVRKEVKIVGKIDE